LHHLGNIIILDYNLYGKPIVSFKIAFDQKLLGIFKFQNQDYDEDEQIFKKMPPGFQRGSKPS
jgi:hypothetical protein